MVFMKKCSIFVQKYILMNYQNYLSSLDTNTYLKILNELKQYFKNYYLENVSGIIAESFSILNISNDYNDEDYYKIQIVLYNYYLIRDGIKIDKTNGNIYISKDDFNIFLRCVKIKNIKNKNYGKTI